MASLGRPQGRPGLPGVAEELPIIHCIQVGVGLQVENGALHLGVCRGCPVVSWAAFVIFWGVFFVGNMNWEYELGDIMEYYGGLWGK